MTVARERLAKLQREMRSHDLGALLLTNPMHVRYATGVSCMPIWTALNLARYALVPAHGDPVLFEYSKALFLARKIWPNARAATAWQYRFSQHEHDRISGRWADEIAGFLREWGVFDAPVGCDPLDYLGWKALREAGIRLADSDPVMDAAKLVKTEAEIELLRRSCEVGAQALKEMEAAIQPEVTENELFGIFHRGMIARGGEFCSTRLLASGEKTNPWFQECGDRKLQPGDLVGIDTDMTGPEGYLCDISRTFLCGDRATDEQRSLYRIARDFIEGTIQECRPGVEYRALLERVPKYPQELAALGYSCMIHGSGFDDEPPFIPFPTQEGALVPRGHLQKNMVLSVEFYAGRPGAKDGVKLEEQVVVTDKGCELLFHYPWDERLQ